ncbi:hypothetical protein EYR40_002149 [Pleurotus pulmonarius]|nr:hypothetical protein EYR36_011445 [Pleurotus pulmonarius]KAF4585312.1 hypothetical protein EYR40_002149 [Pleurotus pulmonarius]KAF4607652.1 hypothetical protein EYR38_001725 [Pleurotus pulmonarius]
MIFTTLTHSREPKSLHNLLSVSQRIHAIAKPLLYRHVAIYCGCHYNESADCKGFRRCLEALGHSITANNAALGALVKFFELVVPRCAVDNGEEQWTGQAVEALIPYLPNLRKLVVIYIGDSDWRTSTLKVTPNPSNLTHLSLLYVYDYPEFLSFLGLCPRLEYLAVSLVEDNNDHLPGVTAPDIVPRLRGACASADFLYFCLLIGRRVEHINITTERITEAIDNAADMDALALPMSLARSLTIEAPHSMDALLRADVIAPYSGLEFLAVNTPASITTTDVRVLGERWPKKIRYLYLRCLCCTPDHDTIAETFLSALPSLILLDIEIGGAVSSASPRCSRYFRANPIEKETDISFSFPVSCVFRGDLWFEEVEDLIHKRLGRAGGAVEDNLENIRRE